MCALYPCVITTHKNESNKHVKAWSMISLYAQINILFQKDQVEETRIL
jgi:hypothetical protein